MHYRSGASWTGANMMKLFKVPTLEKNVARPIKDAELAQKKLMEFRRKHRKQQ